MIHTDGTPTIASRHGGIIATGNRREATNDRRKPFENEVPLSLTKDDVAKLTHLLSLVEESIPLTSQEHTIVAYVRLVNAQAQNG